MSHLLVHVGGNEGRIPGGGQDRAVDMGPKQEKWEVSEWGGNEGEVLASVHNLLQYALHVLMRVIRVAGE